MVRNLQAPPGTDCCHPSGCECRFLHEGLTSLYMLQRAGISDLPGGSVKDSRPFRSASASKARPEEKASAVRLHPSWLAKQKQKEALVQAVPVGSKTVFSDDGQSVASKLTPAAVTGTSGVTSVGCKPQGVEKQTLHPSWLAKKAAASKEALLSSRPLANKTVFED